MKQQQSIVKKHQELKRKDKHQNNKIEGRKSKHQPIIRSSKQKVKQELPIIFKTKKKIQKRDPRFDNLSGKLNYDLYDKSYGFLKEMKQREVDGFKGELNKKGISEEKKQIIRQNIQNNRNEMERYRRTNKDIEVKRKLKKNVNDKI